MFNPAPAAAVPGSVQDGSVVSVDGLPQSAGTWTWRHNLALFLVVAAGFIAWRWPGDLVWDDSPSVCANLYSPDSPQYTFQDPAFFSSIWKELFGRLHSDGYRPLSWTVRRLGLACLVGDQGGVKIAFLIFNGALCGLLGVAFFKFARRFTQTDGGALFALFLVLSSTPLLTGFLVLFTGMQALVPLLMCCALNCYYAALNSKRPAVWMTCLGLILFFGPWYREFIGLIALLIVLLELYRVRGRSGIALLAALCFLHAFYPTFLIHRFVIRNLPVFPVYKLGALGDQVAKGLEDQTGVLDNLKLLIKSLKWRIFLDLFSILPPTLFILAAIPWIRSWRRGEPWPLSREHAGFLGLFFAMTFLPFLKIFKEHVHLAYCLVPLSIILSASVEALWKNRLTWGRARFIVGLLLAVAVADHALNPFVVRGFTRSSYAAIGRLADYCRRELPANSVVLSNAHHTHDVRLYCQGYFDCFDTSVTSGQMSRLVADRQALAEFLKKVGKRPFYCLDVRLPVAKDQLGHDRVHWVVRDQAVEMRPLGEIEHVAYRYPVIDPLKLLLPTRNTSWPGSPDLEFDYYRGPALNGAWWLREVAVSYDLYQVTGHQVR